MRPKNLLRWLALALLVTAGCVETIAPTPAPPPEDPPPAPAPPAPEPPSDPLTLVALGSEWSYLDDGSDQGTAWRALGFDDSAWQTGLAQLGYGDGDETTVVGFGPDSSTKHITTYFRKRFVVGDRSAVRGLRLRLMRDDGAVVYLNGQEVVRSNMPSGAISRLTTASGSVGGSGEDSLHEYGLDSSLLADGTNVLAVEVHQRGASSSDISFDLELVRTSQTTEVTRGPYLQLGTPGSVVVRWRTASPGDSRVVFGTSTNNLDRQAFNAALTTEHVVTLTGLQAGTRYTYGVGNSDGLLAGGDAQFQFTTAPAGGTPVATRIWIIGDSGTADDSAAAVRDAFLQFTGTRVPDLWLMLGDNAYSSGTDSQYQEAVFDMYPSLLRRAVVWPTLGNHDGASADSSSESGPYYDMFTLPRNGQAGGVASGTEAYYSFDHGKIHFICLDSYDTDRSSDGAMLTWLRADLADTLADWVVAFWHHPPYTKGSHDSDSETRLQDMRENALPILEAGGVDLVFAGHSHSYERSYLLDGHYGDSSSLTPAMILDSGDGREDGDGAYTKPAAPAANQGAVYVVAGSSGKQSGGSLDHPAMLVGLDLLGSVVLDIDGGTATVKFLDDAGNVRDHCTIRK